MPGLIERGNNPFHVRHSLFSLTEGGRATLPQRDALEAELRLALFMHCQSAPSIALRLVTTPKMRRFASAVGSIEGLPSMSTDAAITKALVLAELNPSPVCLAAAMSVVVTAASKGAHCRVNRARSAWDVLARKLSAVSFTNSDWDPVLGWVAVHLKSSGERDAAHELLLRLEHSRDRSTAIAAGLSLGLLEFEEQRVAEALARWLDIVRAVELSLIHI